MNDLLSEGAESFVFPPHLALGPSRSVNQENPLLKMSSVPAVPPRKRTEQLPSPLSEDTVRVVWNEYVLPFCSTNCFLQRYPGTRNYSLQIHFLL